MVYRKIQSLLFDGVVKGAVPALGPSLSLFFSRSLCGWHGAFYIAAGCINAEPGPLPQQKVNRLAGGKGHHTVLFSCTPSLYGSIPVAYVTSDGECEKGRVSENAQLPRLLCWHGAQKARNYSFAGKQTIFVMNASTVFLMQTLQIKQVSDETMHSRSKPGFSVV